MSAMTLDQLKRRPTFHVAPRDTITLLGLFAPAALFGLGLLWVGLHDPRFGWALAPLSWPWELGVMAACGAIGTVGGVCDWTFHRLYVTVGPKEHHSHKLALLTGGLPLFLLMAAASVISAPRALLLPVMVVGLYTTALICYDEFVFHLRRCTAIETLFHRLLVFGNGAAWLAWCHFCFVRG